ncbi:MAG: glycosyltransferase [Desulfobulbus sp.]
MNSIYIITPCLNSSETIEHTIYSVFNQRCNFSVHYHVQDGGSSDGTQKKLENFSDEVKKG